MITIYWHCLGMKEADETFVAGALQELAQHLKEDPIKLDITLRRLGDELVLATKVNEKLNRLNDQTYTFSSCAVDIDYLFLKSDLITETCIAKLLVYCSSDNQIALAAKSEAARMNKPPPLWGAANSPLAAAYKVGSKVAIWHEALHLLGLDDCYEEDNPRKKKPHCKLNGCIMEYAPPESTCENWPFLCERNVKKLKELAKKVEEVHKRKKTS